VNSSLPFLSINLIL